GGRLLGALRLLGSRDRLFAAVRARGGRFLAPVAAAAAAAPGLLARLRRLAVLGLGVAVRRDRLGLDRLRGFLAEGRFGDVDLRCRHGAVAVLRCRDLGYRFLLATAPAARAPPRLLLGLRRLSDFVGCRHFASGDRLFGGGFNRFGLGLLLGRFGGALCGRFPSRLLRLPLRR